MATSSLKKSFVISSKKEADAFVKMFSDSLKNPPKPIKEVETFLKTKAVQATKLNTATTYLVYKEIPPQVKTALSYLSGKTVFLECEKEQKLIDFYKEQGFILLDNEITTKNSKELLQIYRLI